ncbi:hypothetical protein R1sor_027182 [Riccia sorocarpa]|uniref:Endonuclease/exonuclease/phosphatase domain-containing protein n=1 Tax=Riccia sorocarpa TaxID=122646 RepID=A0ABD3GFM2_9MARC
MPNTLPIGDSLEREEEFKGTWVWRCRSVGAPIYQRLGSGEDPLSALTEAVIAVHELGPVWVVGDFNSRVGDAQSLELNEEGVVAWRNSDADESWCRSAEDEGWNGMSEFFMQFAAAGGLTIINGTAPFPDTRSVTCRTHNGSSTVDFLLACKSARDRILDFSFGPFSPESDHRPLRCTLMGFEREIRRQDRRSKVGVCLDVTKWNQYETTLVNKLHGRELTSGTLPNIITGIAKEVFTAKQPRDKGWFDDDCRVARSKAMSAVDQRAAFRQYNHFIRACKRRFLRQHQRVLVGELMKCPKTFWQRFRSRRILPELKAEDLYNFTSEFLHKSTADIHTKHSESHMQGVGLQIYIVGLHNGSSLKKTGDRWRDCVIVLPKRSFGSFGLSLVRDKLIIYVTFLV